MEKLTFRKKIRRSKASAAKVDITHQQQTGVNWCWAASALMSTLEKKQTQLTLVNSFLFGKPHQYASIKCTTKACATQIVKTNRSSTDYPLCLKCKKILLNTRLYKPQKTYKLVDHSKTETPRKFEKIYKRFLNGLPLIAYCSRTKYAHYMVIFGAFSVHLSKHKYNFLMIADPDEAGVGFCEYETFKRLGAYNRRSRYFDWTWSLM